MPGRFRPEIASVCDQFTGSVLDAVTWMEVTLAAAPGAVYSRIHNVLLETMCLDDLWHEVYSRSMPSQFCNRSSTDRRTCERPGIPSSPVCSWPTASIRSQSLRICDVPGDRQNRWLKSIRHDAVFATGQNRSGPCWQCMKLDRP